VTKKVLIFSLAYFPLIGGAEVAIKEITERLPEFEFAMITNKFKSEYLTEELIGNIKVYRVGTGQKWDKYVYPWRAFRLAKKLQNTQGFDTVWAMMANQAGLAALKFKRQFPAVKYLLTLQEGDSERDIWLRTWFMRPLYKAIYRRADYIQAISNFLANRAKRLGAKCPVAVVPNGVSVGDNSDRPVQDSRIIVSVSRLVKKNGLEYLIKAIKEVDGRLLIIGDGKLRRKLENLTNSLLLKNKVEFLGFLPQSQINHYLLKSQVFCRPSLSEGLGNAFLEAMAMGVPVVGTAVGGIPDFLKDGETGLICEVNNPASIAEKIKELLTNQALREKVTKNAFQLVAEKYDWNKIALRMGEIL